LEHGYAHPPSKVWEALTDPKLHALWWAAGDVRPVVGHRFELDMGSWGKQSCEVLEAEHERLLKYRFATGTLDTIITWQLIPENGGRGSGSLTRVSILIRRWGGKPWKA
jgi:uncharacterized protein YndB with AHSA1/START domain